MRLSRSARAAGRCLGLKGRSLGDRIGTCDGGGGDACFGWSCWRRASLLLRLRLDLRRGSLGSANSLGLGGSLEIGWGSFGMVSLSCSLVPRSR